MEGKFSKNMRTPIFNIEDGAELECWRKFIKRFEIAVIGAGLKQIDVSSAKSRKKAAEADAKAFDMEQRKAALLLDSMGEYGLHIFETWDIDIDQMQYEPLKRAFEDHFASRENIVATRHRFLSMEQSSEEKLDKFIERIERSGSTCRWGGLEEEMNIQIIIKGMHVDKVRNELLLKKDLTLAKVKEFCNRYESAMTATKILKKTEPSPISEVDAVIEPTETSTNDDYIARVGRNNSNQFRGNRGRGYRGRGRGRGCWTCGEFNHDYKACREKNEREKEQKTTGKRELRCFVCGDKSHLARECKKAYGHKDEARGNINAVDHYSSDSEESLTKENV